jgi:hypothetical protein
MTFLAKHIDVNNADHMALVKAHAVHPDNPFAFRLECQLDGCANQVWPSQLYDVRQFPGGLSRGASFACDGCVERWIRQPDFPLDIPALMRAHGAPETEIDGWVRKCDDAKPEHIFLQQGE